MPDASIIIRTFNEEKSLEETIKKIRGQKTKRKTEIIIVDSESTDKTRKIAEKHADKIIDLEKKSFTYGRALNLGCEKAGSDTLILLSAHAVPADENWMETLLQHMGDPKTAGAYGRQLPAKDCNPLSERQIINFWDTKPKKQEANHFFTATNCAIKKKIWLKNRFDEDMPATEDHMWAKKAQEKGYHVLYEPEAKVYHSHNETPRQHRQRTLNEIHGAMKVYNPFKTAARYLAGSIIYTPLDIIYILQKGESPKWIRESISRNILQAEAAIHALIKHYLA